MIDQRLEALITRTAQNIGYPPTPDLTARVVARVSGRTKSPDSSPLAPLGRGLGSAAGLRPALGLVLVVAALVLVAALAIAPTRDAIARLFGVEGSKIEFLPTPLPGETATPFPTPLLQGVFEPIELEDVTDRAGFEPALPDVPEPRQGSEIVFYGRQAVVVHHYEDFDLWQTRLDQYAGFGKGLPEGGEVVEAKVGGVPGRWVTGAPHIVYYYTLSNVVFQDSQRTVERNTLIWRTDAFFYRIETDLPLAEALRIAETLP